MSQGAMPGLDFWEPKRLTSLADARDRVIFINRLRIALLALAAIALAALFVSAVIMSIERESHRPQKFEAEDIVRMVNPRFSGRTTKGEPYQVLAESAMRRKGDPNIIDLVAPIMKDVKGGTLSSATGIYNTETKIIELTGKVKFLDPIKGLSFDTRNSVVLLAESRVYGRTGISGKGQMGSIQSNAYEIRDGGQIVLFTGGVRTRLAGRAARPAASAPSR
jgi:lipopolysaccharide export system protein LptC